MSNRWGYLCISHDPELAMDPDSRINRGRDELAELWAKREEWAEADPAVFEYAPRWHQIQWLRDHVHCDVLLVDEYSERLDPADLTRKPKPHCPSCTCELT